MINRSRYRFVFFGRPRGPWRERKREALQDAIAAGEARWDPDDKVVYTNPGAEIDWEDVRE